MKKRGQLVYKALVVIIGGALIILGFLQAGKEYGSQEAFYKLAVAKDLALAIDLMYALPGNIEFTYPNDISGYDVEIKENTVRVYNGEGDKVKGIYTYAGTDMDLINVHIENSKFIKLQKINNNIIITGVAE